MNKIFLKEGTWYGFIAPEEPNNDEQLHDYKMIYKEAKAGALPILNPEIIEKSIQIFYNWVDLKPHDEDYDWPGGMKEHEQYWTGSPLTKNSTMPEWIDVGEGDVIIKGLKNNRRGYILSLPNSAKDECPGNETVEDGGGCYVAGAKDEKESKLDENEIEALKTIGIIAENWFAVLYNRESNPIAIFADELHAIAYKDKFTATSIIEPWPMVIRDFRKGGITKIKN
jgi:hypothetical protein